MHFLAYCSSKMTSVVRIRKSSISEQMQCIQNKLAWIEKLTKQYPAYQWPTGESANLPRKCDQSVPTTTVDNEIADNKGAIISELNLIHEKVAEHIEEVLRISQQVKRLHLLSECIRANKRRYRYNAIRLGGLQGDLQVHQKLHWEMMQFSHNLPVPLVFLTQDNPQ